MEKLILKDGTEIEIEAGSFLGYITARVNSYADFADLAKKLTDDNLSDIVIGSQSYKNTTIAKSEFKLTNEEDHIKAKFALREMTADELKIPAAEQAAEMLTDEQAVKIKGLYPIWKSLIGKTVKSGTRFTYGDDLYKVIAPEPLLIQEQYIPGQGTSSIYSRISDDEQEGTIDNPIEVPEDVTTNAFTYVIGKYYSWNGQTYICQRQGEEDGTEHSFVYSPDQLIGQYFEIVEE